jgi:hypothetical protein
VKTELLMAVLAPTLLVWVAAVLERLWQARHGRQGTTAPEPSEWGPGVNRFDGRSGAGVSTAVVRKTHWPFCDEK